MWEPSFVSLPSVLGMIIEHILLEAVSGHVKEEVTGHSGDQG